MAATTIQGFAHPKYAWAKAWFSYVGKIPDYQGFYFSPTVPDFADISDNRQKSVLDSPDIEFGNGSAQKLKFVHKRVIGGLEPNSLEGW